MKKRPKWAPVLPTPEPPVLQRQDYLRMAQNTLASYAYIKYEDSKPTPLDRDHFIYLFACSYDPGVVIFGITCDLQTRAAAEPSYGQLLASIKATSRPQALRWEAAFKRAPVLHAVGPDHRGRTTWTEARRMPADTAAQLLQRVTVENQS